VGDVRKVACLSRVSALNCTPECPLLAGVTAAHRAASAKDPVGSRDFDYLRDEVAARLVDRLNDITREFPVALDLGANTGNIVKQLSGHGGVKKLFMLDSCRA